jgi:SAM-dependent methyltransferase
VPGFYREQSPSYLSFSCALQGYEPVPVDRPFTYFELGFGRGVTVNVLAATNPLGNFYAADFNPAHVAGASAMASAAGLDNLTLLEDSFEDLATGKRELPQFDFITLHGIYTWVTRENQQHIVNFIKRYLKPGGILYLSYNAMPGWAPSTPLQRLLVEYGDAFPNRSDIQAKAAVRWIEQMSGANAGFLVANPVLKARIDTLKSANPNYLVHEYMHKHWSPLYHADVARDLATAKLDFAGSADLGRAYPQLYLTPERKAVVDVMPDPAMRETVIDYFLNTAFRKDIFIRGARRLTPMASVRWLEAASVALTVPRSKVSTKLNLSFGPVDGKEAVYHPVLDALEQRPHSLAELRRLPTLSGSTLGDIAQVAALLAAAGYADVFFAGRAAAPDRARALNRVVAEQNLDGVELGVLCSPVLGHALPSGFMDLVVYQVISTQGEASLEVLAQRVWAQMKQIGKRMLKDGVAVEGDEANLAIVLQHLPPILAERVPVWKSLGII